MMVVNVANPIMNNPDGKPCSMVGWDGFLGFILFKMFAVNCSPHLFDLFVCLFTSVVSFTVNQSWASPKKYSLNNINHCYLRTA